MTEYLINTIVQDQVSVILPSGQETRNKELLEIIYTCHHLTNQINQLAKKIDPSLLEILAVNGLMTEEMLFAEDKSELTSIINNLNETDISPDRSGWSFETHDKHIDFYRFIRGVKISYLIYRDKLSSHEFKELSRLGGELSHIFSVSNHCTINIGNNSVKVYTPRQLVALVNEQAKKGLHIQRFKGLGEMNADQLWETTLDPSKRTLLQIKITDIDEIEDTISTLMGSVVEPRREFIKANALNVMNLDV
jgi:DNA gyrase subunit B